MVAGHLKTHKNTGRDRQVRKSKRQWTIYVARHGQVSNQILVTCQTYNTVRSSISL